MFKSLLLLPVVVLLGCSSPESPFCNPTTCSGCCDSNGACVDGNTVAACGSAGATCSVCGAQNVCAVGTCLPESPVPGDTNSQQNHNTTPDAGSEHEVVPNTDLYPLSVGAQWVYSISGDYGSCADTLTTKIIKEVNGTYTVNDSCGLSTEYLLQKSGGDIYVGTSEMYLSLDLPAVAGKQFAAGGASGALYKWRAVPSITVPAGTFANCWAVDQIGYDISNVYCPGVGPVRMDMHAFGYDFVEQLTSHH